MTLGEEFCKALLAAMPDPRARMLCAMELRKWGGKTLYLPAARKSERRLAAARNMLKNGMSAADAARAVHEQFRVTLRTAQRDVKSAGNLSR